MELALCDESVRFIEEQVKAGNYPSARAVVEAALADLRCHQVEELDEETLAAIRKGDAEGERGEGVELSEFRREMDAHMGRR